MIGAILAILAALLLLAAGRSRREPATDEGNPPIAKPPLSVGPSYPSQSRFAPPAQPRPTTYTPRRWGRIAAALILGLILLSAAALAAPFVLVYRITHPGNLEVSPATSPANSPIRLTLRNNATGSPCDCGPLEVYALPRGFRQDWSEAVGLGRMERLDDTTYGGTITRVNLPPGTYDIFAGQGYQTSLIWGSGTLTITR